MKLEIKGKEQLSSIVEVEKFIECLKSLDKFFRINTLKISEEKFKEITDIEFENTEVSFVKRLKSKIKLGATLEYFLGLIHPQSLSSSLACVALSPKENEIILDCCASPGGKTTLISMLMRNTGAVVANDRRDRIKPLLHNIARLGVLNTITTTYDAKKVIKEDYFDKALVDVPCSALGAYLNAWKRFEIGIAKSLSRVQKRMIVSAFDSLRQGGELVYSTCTITEEENEEVVKFLLEKRENAKLVSFDLGVKHDRGLVEYGKEFNKVARIYPFHFNSEGFFIAKIKKE